jgi:rhamnopyranosyl-N-acetylglucosaminyl-diphospho-decaprenol beta-1,3/1,4-galactofuranosyltransferase
MRICVVVVTYNRSAWLIECLNSLILQNHKIEGVVVINNASTDNTKSCLDEFAAKNKNILNWHITHAPVNSGGSGGFAQGMKVAHQAGYDWIWLMDDDVLVHPEALNNLLQYKDQAQILHGRRVGPDGRPFYWQSVFLPWLGFCRPYPDSIFKTKDIWFTNTACFEGALIHKSVFDKIGYADKRYFMVWDDTEFGYRASQSFNVAYCNCLTLIRQRGEDNIDIGVRSLYRATDMYRYFHVRNRFLLVRTILKNEPRSWARVLKRITFHAFTFILICKEVVRAILFKDWGMGLKPMMLGFKDGVLNHFGSMPFK